MMRAALHDLLNHCIAGASNELGPKELKPSEPSEIYADMARRLLAVVLESDSDQYDNGEQIITVRLADVQAWLIEAHDLGGISGVSGVDVTWRLTDLGWKPTLSRIG